MLQRSNDYLHAVGGHDAPTDRKAQTMTEQAKIDPKAALAALDQAYAYYQPEPFLVKDDAGRSPEDVNEDVNGYAYYRAA